MCSMNEQHMHIEKRAQAFPYFKISKCMTQHTRSNYAVPCTLFSATFLELHLYFAGCGFCKTTQEIRVNQPKTVAVSASLN